MDINRIKKEDGYALMVVIGLSLVVMLIASSIIFSDKSALGSAIAFENRTKSYFKAESAFETALFYIMTSSVKSYYLETSGNDVEEKWSLAGDPVYLDPETTLKIRDAAGMISFYHGMKYLKKNNNDVNSNFITGVSYPDSIADWQDKDDLKKLNGAESWQYEMAGISYEPRNFYIQVPEEIKLCLGYNERDYRSLIESGSFITAPYTNFMTMSRLGLSFFLKNDKIIDSILEQRKNFELTKSKFIAATGIKENQYQSFWPHTRFSIDIETDHNGSRSFIHAVIEKKRNRIGNPFELLEWKKL